MADHDVYVEVGFLDAAERTATVRYLLERQYDDVANNIAAVISDVADLETALAGLSMAEVVSVSMQIDLTTGDSPANVAANNQIRAFSRCLDADGEKCSFEVPSWDDVVFDQDSNNLLSTAYNTAADAVRNLLKNPETNASMASLSWTQSRTHKSRNRLS